ncbi:o-succinylbenzoate--CoA ligase [Halobacillus fulvus]|nr:o-succinylbenzoate--CoA ligase [Halobacillus fulvus]
MGEKIPHWLDKQVELNPNKEALRLPHRRTLTFKELQIKSRAVGAGMKQKGIDKGTTIALLLDNQEEMPVWIHAVSYVGAIAVLLNNRLTAEEIAYQLNDADVSYVFTNDRLIDVASEATSSIPIWNVDDFQPSSRESVSLVEDLDLDEVFTMMYTSGTTGHPKAVMHTYGNHYYSAISSALNLGLQSDDQWLLCLPMFHVGGFSMIMKGVIYGVTVEILEKFHAETVLEAIFNRGITHVSVVTVMLQRLIEQLGNQTYPDHFRCMLLGGGPVPEKVLKQSYERNIPVFQTYGMTETSSQIATLSPEFAFQKLGSAGKALSPASLIVDADQGEVGEILVRGPMVSKGYYNRPVPDQDYFRTGDLGYQDEDGFLYVVDRVKDVIISGGENIYPAEIESVLTSYPGVREAGVTGRKDEQWGEAPVAFLVVDDPTSFRKEDVLRFCEEKLAKYKWPKDIHTITSLPRNASNKILRRKLFEALEEERL